MMPSSRQTAEIRDLADAMFDGRIDANGIDRLEKLLAEDPASLQAYLEMINLHGELLHQADSQTDREAVLSVLQDFTLACERRQADRFRKTLFLSVSAVCGLICLAVWGLFAEAFRPVPLANVAHLTSDASLESGSAELGQVIRQGETLSIKKGVISLQLEHALIDVVGPAEFRLEQAQQIFLHQGRLVAQVLPQGEGLTVRTPDAEVVDLGTEFQVTHSPQNGSEVSVRRGRARASLLDWQGRPTKTLELTANRAVQLRPEENISREIAYEPELFDWIDERRGGIRSLDGNVRTLGYPVRSFRSNRVTTPSYLLIVPEQQNIRLEKDLEIHGLDGPVRIPAGSLVSSYLAHFDPTDLGIVAPRGAVTFFGTIAAVVGSAKELAATDAQFGLKNTFYETASFRQIETDADEIRLSADRKVFSFFFGAEPPHYLDEARILVISDHP